MTTFVAGPVVAWSVATTLTPEAQGFYYSFGSLLAFLYLFEAGLSQVVIVLVAQIPESAVPAPATMEEARREGLEALRRIARFALGRFALLGIPGLVVLGAAGAIMFARVQAHEEWAIPWAILCLVSAGNFLLQVPYAILQGLGHVESYWLFRCVQQAVYGITLIVGLQIGLRLSAAPLAAACMLSWAGCFLVLRHGVEMRQAFGKPQSELHWTKELARFQTRIGATQVATFLGPQALVPLCFVAAGPVWAGRLGLSWSLASFVQAFGQNVVLTRFPVLARQEARPSVEERGSGPWRLAVVASLVTLLGGAAVSLGVAVLEVWRPALASRVLAPAGVLALVAVAAIAVFVQGVSAWFRARRRDPLAWFAVAACVFGVLGAGAGVLADGVTGLVLGFVLGNTTILAAGLSVAARVHGPAGTGAR